MSKEAVEQMALEGFIGRVEEMLVVAKNEEGADLFEVVDMTLEACYIADKAIFGFSGEET